MQIFDKQNNGLLFSASYVTLPSSAQKLLLKVCPCNLQLETRCNTQGCWTHLCCSCFLCSVPLTGMIEFTLRSLTENSCQGVMNICGATMLIISFQSACMLTAMWLHDVPHLAFRQKVAGVTGKIEKPLGNTCEVLQCRKDSVLWHLGADSSHSQEVSFLPEGIMLVVLALFG